MRTIFGFICAVAALATSSFAHAQSTGRVPRSAVTQEVRQTARKLAHAWIDTASAGTLDQLADRSIAFAGMVPGLFVVLDGHRMSATQALKDSALTILGQHTTGEDAEAIRNTVYALMEIADGRASRGSR